MKLKFTKFFVHNNKKVSKHKFSKNIIKRQLSNFDKNGLPIISVDNDQFDYQRSNKLLYIDKTKHLTDLISSKERFIFLSRPRKFGKTLLQDTLKCMFRKNDATKQAIFEGTYFGEQTDLMQQFDNPVKFF